MRLNIIGENLGDWNLDKKKCMYALSIYNWYPRHKRLLIIRWWCYITYQRLRGHYDLSLWYLFDMKSTSTPHYLVSYPSSDPSVHYSAGAAGAAARSPPNYNPNCCHHILDTINSYNIGQVVIYWAIVFWQRSTYISTSSRCYT